MMFLRKYLRNQTKLMFVGVFCLVAGALLLRYLAAYARVTPDLADGVAGLFYGLAIGCLAMSMLTRFRRCGGRRRTVREEERTPERAAQRST